MLNFKSFLAESKTETKAAETTPVAAIAKSRLWEEVVATVLETRGDNFNKGQKKPQGPLLKTSELDKIKRRHREEDKRNKGRQRSERERAEVSDFRNKDMERKRMERERLEKIRKGVYECAFIEEVYTHLGNEKFEMLLRNGLAKRSDMIRFKLALEKLNTGTNPTIIERDIFFGVFNKIVKFITEDPVLFTQIHRKAVQTRA